MIFSTAFENSLMMKKLMKIIRVVSTEQTRRQNDSIWTLAILNKRSSTNKNQHERNINKLKCVFFWIWTLVESASESKVQNFSFTFITRDDLLKTGSLSFQTSFLFANPQTLPRLTYLACSLVDYWKRLKMLWNTVLRTGTLSSFRTRLGCKGALLVLMLLHGLKFYEKGVTTGRLCKANGQKKRLVAYIWIDLRSHWEVIIHDLFKTCASSE